MKNAYNNHNLDHNEMIMLLGLLSQYPLLREILSRDLTARLTSISNKQLGIPSFRMVFTLPSGGADPTPGGFLDRTGNDFLVGGIRTVIDPDTNLQKVYVPQSSVTNGSRLDDGRVCHEMVDEFAPPKFFASVCGMEHGQLFTEFNVGAARQMSLSAEVRMRDEYNIKKKRRLKSVVKEKDELLKARDEEIENLKAQMLLKEAEAAEAIRLRAEVSTFETVEKSLQDEVNALKEHNAILEKERTALDVKVMDLEASVVCELGLSSFGLQEKVTMYEDCMGQLEKFQDDWMEEVNNKFDKLYYDFIEMALHFEERFYPHLLTTIFGSRWLLTYGMELAITKFLNSPEYISALGAAIGKVIEKGMQDGLVAGITHGKEGRELTDVVAHNPSAKVDYVSALQQLQDVNFSLLVDLKSNKDASVETVMNILRMEDLLAKKLGLSKLQPRVDQLMVPIHRSPDQVVLSASALSLALDVSSSRVRKIKENIALKALLIVIPATVDTTTTLSITFAFANIIAPISVYDYEVMGMDDQASVDGNATPFPNVDDADKRQESDAVCYTKPLDSLKRWNDHFFWVDSFTCHASFPWHTAKNVSKDPFPKSSEFNAEHYAILVAHPTPF
ncbi:hypothetical protein Tco_0624107 [Tanacetum coccineum]|uniref:Transposase (Putative), gypsy type n=1 Tax=Tanacetum coccineum TaxID=301880 RepID=A0ABQ4WCX7_9ASTR